MSAELSPNVAMWLASVANALQGLTTFDAGFGTFDLGDIPVTFDGEQTDLTLASSEFSDELTIRIGRADA